MSALEPDELRRLLHEAVDELTPGPGGYDRIREGVRRRRRMRVPALAAGGLALAGVVGLAYVAVSPGDSNQSPGANPPPITTGAPGPSGGGSTGGGPAGPGQAGLPGGSASGGTAGTTGGPGGPGGSGTPRGGVSATPSATGPSSSPRTGQPTSTGGGGAQNNSPTLAPPVAIPAADGDLDGDGVADPVSVTGTTLAVDASSEGQMSVTLRGDPSGAAAIVDINRDGRGEVIVNTGGGDGTDGPRSFDVYTLTLDGLRLVTGGPSPIQAGVGDGHGYGLRCDVSAGVITTTAGTSTGGGAYSVTSTTWRLDGTAFTRSSVSTPSTVSGTGSFTVGGCGSLR